MGLVTLWHVGILVPRLGIEPVSSSIARQILSIIHSKVPHEPFNCVLLELPLVPLHLENCSFVRANATFSGVPFSLTSRQHFILLFV